MKAVSKSVFYIGTIGVLLVIIYWIVTQGAQLEGVVAPVSDLPLKHPQSFGEEMWKVLRHPLSVFLFQLMVILITVRIAGGLFRKIGQPAVVGEMVAGIVLGPSLVGTFFPAFSAFVFPPESLPHLQLISQVGLILFMFVIGMELDLKLLKNKAGSAVIISHASIVFPYVLGVALAYFLYKEMAPAGVRFYSFALFMGIAMSITAFPVLARVIRERGLTGTRLGTMAITCAAADDITAWCILGFVIAVAKASSVMSAVYILAMTIGYVVVMMLVLKPLLARLAKKWLPQRSMQQSVVAIVFVVLLVSAYVCEVIGIHALFGAFMAGIVMPDEWSFRKILIDKIEDVALILFLPLFFVFTGLRTQIGLLNDSSLWGMCLLIILVAVAGKFGGSAVAARFTGETLKDSLSIGALMNTRGLMELVVLNIGYDLGILSPEIFTMMVLMAIITTLMTSPLLTLIGKMKDRP
jgi:Kef-type K+ transport system membrane component KefB